MTFPAYETSRNDGTPAEFLEIVYGDTASDVVRLTSADYDFDLNGNTFLSSFMKRDAITDDSNPYDGEQLKITLKKDNPFAAIFLEQDFKTVVTLTLYQAHLDDPDQAAIILWSGRLASVEWQYPNMVINSERLDLYMNGYALTMRYQVGQCVHTIYHGLCRLNRDDWQVAGTVSLITDNTLLTIAEAAAYPDGYFTGGILRLNGINRFVLQHIGTQVWINRSLKALAVDDAVTLYPSCQRLAQTCNDVFNNGDNYLAFDWMPYVSGYGSSGIL